MTLDGSGWYQVKDFAEHALSWPMDTLHVMLGVILQLLAAALLRTSLSDVRPWLAVFILELGNEAYDLWFEAWPSLSIQLGEGLRDLLGTMLLPTFLLVVARCAPRLLAGPR